MAELRVHTEQRFQELAAAQRRTEERVTELAVAQRRTEEQVAAVSAQLADLIQVVQTFSTDIGELKGRSLEGDYRTRVYAYFSRVVRRAHALSPDEVEGPLPQHLVLEPGETPRADLIRAVTRGVFIPRFHYVSGLLNPREALMTGLTREGACLIEHGKLTTPITTMRFTQSCLEAFQHVRGISSEQRLIADPAQDAGCAIMPTLHLATFRFTGRSDD